VIPQRKIQKRNGLHSTTSPFRHFGECRNPVNGCSPTIAFLDAGFYRMTDLIFALRVIRAKKKIRISHFSEALRQPSLY
jgi:hypothetical protein